MQSLSLPSARRPAPAAVGVGRYSCGLPHVGHQPLTPGQGDTILGWNHCKLRPYSNISHYIHMFAWSFPFLIRLHDPA